MRVAYDHQIFSTQRFGGISRYFYELVKHLEKVQNTSIECRVFSPLHINNYLSNGGGGLHACGFCMPDIRYAEIIRRVVNELLLPPLLRGWGPDIIHETYYAERSVSVKKCRTVITVYDMIHELFPEYFLGDRSILRRKKAAIERADHIICISENTRDDLVRLYGVPADRTTVVHLGFALAKSPISGGVPLDRPYILYVGSRGGYKNFDRLLEAYAQRPSLYKNYDLVAFGGGAFNMEEIAKIAAVGLDAMQVHQFGGDDSVLGVFYKNADLFVYPSLYEGFGIPPLEAMGFDCPVACSNTSSIPEVVGDAAVFFNPYEAASIADALESVLGNSLLQESLRRGGRARTKFFSWLRCAEETLQVYRSVLQ